MTRLGQFAAVAPFSVRTSPNGWPRFQCAIPWAAEQGHIEPDVALRLTRVRRLQRGRSVSDEYRDIEPVAWATVEPTMAECSEVLAAMIELQWHTGMRPDEVCRLRTGDLDTNGEV
jgi:integrase